MAELPTFILNTNKPTWKEVHEVTKMLEQFLPQDPALYLKSLPHLEHELYHYSNRKGTQKSSNGYRGATIGEKGLRG